MVGIKDYTYQNIIFVHDFVFIFLTFIFFMIVCFFTIIVCLYSIDLGAYKFHLIEKRHIHPTEIFAEFLYRETAWYKKLSDTKMMRRQRIVMGKTRRGKFEYIDAINFYSNFATKYLKKTHNLNLEIIWTFIPIIIILELIFPSLSLIADDEISSKSSLYTVSVIGNQWYWTYELNVIMNTIKYMSNLVLIDKTQPSNKEYTRLLITNNAVSIPVGIKTSFFITSNDVAHSWAIPGLGLKIDAIPGRINLKTITASKLGLYSGMCSELCGIDHGFMPISLKVLTISDWGYNLEYYSKSLLNSYNIKNILWI